MEKCAYCGTTILFGGSKQGNLRFCNSRCAQHGFLAQSADKISPYEVKQFVDATHMGNCPVCQGRGPVDVHVSHRVWSAIVMTSWASQPVICCNSCGVKNKLRDTLISLLLGWWGFPWGLIMTPIQVLRNLIGLAKSPDPLKPSPELERLLRLQMAAKLQQQAKLHQDGPSLSA